MVEAVTAGPLGGRDATAQPPTPAAGPAPAGALTRREAEVLRLLVAGGTDRQIAAALFISPRTVHGHVTRLFAKLGVGTRTAAVAAALRGNLVADRSNPGTGTTLAESSFAGLLDESGTPMRQS